MSRASDRDRVAVVAGLRTPFSKAGTALEALRAPDLGAAVVAELIQRAEIDPALVTLCVFGQVVPSLDWLNLARDVALRAGLPRTVEAFSVSRACATSIQAMTSAAEAIHAGHHDVAVAGGADSMSDVPLGVSRPLARALRRAQRARSLAERLGSFAGVSPGDLVPPVPGFAREPSTGETMGEAAEKMARDNGISREEQDAIALRSHLRAARAAREGVFDAQVMPLFTPSAKEPVQSDNLVRPDATLDALARLPPVFDRRHGTVTAGNSSPLTDGASALLLVRESRARALGLEPLGYLRSFAYAAVDPAWQLLMAPVFAVPVALARAGATLGQMAVVDMHEAFAAQVASNLQALASRRFARERLDRDQAVGEIDPERLNVHGGSIALGHPFAATGARMVLSTLLELRRRGGELALVTVCAAGGLGAAVVLEVGP